MYAVTLGPKECAQALATGKLPPMTPVADASPAADTAPAVTSREQTLRWAAGRPNHITGGKVKELIVRTLMDPEADTLSPAAFASLVRWACFPVPKANRDLYEWVSRAAASDRDGCTRNAFFHVAICRGTGKWIVNPESKGGAFAVATNGHRMHIRPVARAEDKRLKEMDLGGEPNQGGLYYYVDSRGVYDAEATRKYADAWPEWERLIVGDPLRKHEDWENIDLREIEYDYQPARKDKRAMLLGCVRGVWFQARYLWDAAGAVGRLYSLNQPRSGKKAKAGHFLTEDRRIGSCLSLIMPVGD